MDKNLKIARRILLLLLICCLVLPLFSACTEKTETEIVIGIAWRADTDSEFYTNVTDSLNELNIKYKLLDQVVLSTIAYDGAKVDASLINENDYLEQATADLVKSAKAEDSNVAAVLEGISGVIFTGGEDVSPTLYSVPEIWHGIEDEKDYNPARDVSDYLLLSYCISQNLPTIGFCRGLQMLGVVGGATMIQDIPTFFESKSVTYDFTHRNNKSTPDSYRDYAAHNVSVTDKNSKFYEIVATDELQGVPSWHHQALLSVENTNLKVTGTTATCGVDMIEALEYSGTLCNIAFQFHPEAAIAKNLKNVENSQNYMSKSVSERFFAVFIQYCK